MKKLLLPLALCLVTMISTSAFATSPGAGKTKLIHMVSFKFKDTATPAQIKEVEEAFRGLKKKIPQIRGLEWGTNISPEKHDKGFTHAWILSFKSAKERDAYLVHPEHKKFGQSLGPVLGDVFVVDFWAQR
ncbi:MAG: Dabb family protein [Verrucomicrobia bacterium]|nr:Dabb family protein [Verrucomicrobiota bacterium]